MIGRTLRAHRTDRGIAQPGPPALHLQADEVEHRGQHVEVRDLAGVGRELRVVVDQQVEDAAFGVGHQLVVGRVAHRQVVALHHDGHAVEPAAGDDVLDELRHQVRRAFDDALEVLMAAARTFGRQVAVGVVGVDGEHVEVEGLARLHELIELDTRAAEQGVVAQAPAAHRTRGLAGGDPFLAPHHARVAMVVEELADPGEDQAGAVEEHVAVALAGEDVTEAACARQVALDLLADVVAAEHGHRLQRHAALGGHQAGDGEVRAHQLTVVVEGHDTGQGLERIEALQQVATEKRGVGVGVFQALDVDHHQALGRLAPVLERDACRIDIGVGEVVLAEIAAHVARHREVIDEEGDAGAEHDQRHDPRQGVVGGVAQHRQHALPDRAQPGTGPGLGVDSQMAHPGIEPPQQDGERQR